MRNVKDFVTARALLVKHGHNDTMTAGAIGKAYVEEFSSSNQLDKNDRVWGKNDRVGRLPRQLFAIEVPISARVFQGQAIQDLAHTGYGFLDRVMGIGATQFRAGSAGGNGDHRNATGFQPSTTATGQHIHSRFAGTIGVTPGLPSIGDGR